MEAKSPHRAREPNAMGPPAHPASSMASKKLDINSLMSPPDHVHDSFANTHHQYDIARPASSGNDPATPPMPMSPPISPYSKSISTAETTTTPSVKDPVLYPADEIPSSPAQSPLFAPAEIEEHDRIIDDHLRARESTSFAFVPAPRREDLHLALEFKSQVYKLCAANPLGWLRRERGYLEADRRNRLASGSGNRYHSILPAKPAKAPRTQRTDRVQKPQSVPRPIRTHIPASASPMRPTPRVSATPEPSRRIVAPNREDKDFKSLPNYCPPQDSLPSRPNSLKVDWKGQPIDLSDDPFVNLLHPDEVSLASNLRLDCATYLTSKRRIFDRRLTCLRNDKEFRKTDAQQACKIDVNKASKLWTAFDKVGWLDAKWVRQYL
ncbi:hypothetical protein F66182_6873 [Fusarium sp. NRRL 66182]|nr:hypothetical protein F66182_6873 [Fusarium sp. NRRL 66182]